MDFVSEMLFFAGYCCSIMMIVLVSGSCAIPFFFVVFLQVLLIVNRLGFLKKKTEPLACGEGNTVLAEFWG